MNRVEVALCRAQTAADAAIVVNGRCPASEASCRLCLHLLFRQRNPQILEGLRRDAGLVPRNLALRIVEAFHLDIVPVKLDERPQVAVDCKRLSRVDKPVDGYHPLAAVRDRVDRKPRTVVHVAAHKDIRLRRLKRHSVRLCGSISVQLNPGALQQIPPDHRLPD